MAIRVVRLGCPRISGEGVRLGTVRRPPRGVRKADFAAKDYFDLWLPELAPSAEWVKWALSEPFTAARWAKYEKNYRREMSEPSRRRQIQLLALLSRSANFSVGCYCADESHCHRSILRQLLLDEGAKLAR